MGTMFLSIVIPAYNESKKIHRDIQAAAAFLEAQDFDSEVLIVDDGSADNTLEVLQRYVEKLPAGKVKFQALGYRPNRGKGHAVRYGIERASGNYVGFVDAGLCVPFSYVTKAIEKLEAGSDYAIASRRLQGTKIVAAQPLYRRVGSKVFWVIMRNAMGIRVTDTQCGFKFYRQEAAKSIFSRVTTDGFMFDIEALLVANQLGLKGAEFPVEWSNDSDTRYRPIGGTIRNLKELINIRLRTLSWNPNS